MARKDWVLAENVTCAFYADVDELTGDRKRLTFRHADNDRYCLSLGERPMVYDPFRP